MLNDRQFLRIRVSPEGNVEMRLTEYDLNNRPLKYSQKIIPADFLQYGPTYFILEDTLRLLRRALRGLRV